MTKTFHKCIQALDRLLNAAVVAAALLILFISVYSLLDNLWLYKNASDPSLLVYKPKLDISLDHFREVSGQQGELLLDKQAAWLCIPDTGIDYPIMQGEDNYEFLNKDPYGEFKLSGSIFLDYRNHRDFLDEYSLVYGHHMEHGAMFGSLDLFQDESYFDAHRTGWLVTDGAVYDLELFAVTSADGYDQTIFDPAGRTCEEINGFLNENAIIYTPPEEGLRMVALSTCYGESFSSRLIVLGTIRER